MSAFTGSNLPDRCALGLLPGCWNRGVHMGFMCLKVPDCSPVFI